MRTIIFSGVEYEAEQRGVQNAARILRKVHVVDVFSLYDK